MADHPANTIAPRFAALSKFAMPLARVMICLNTDKAHLYRLEPG